jgi:glycosyltransferase involved in cell wall biosynthesis
MLTTGGEGFGLPIIEWMACGIPVLATDYAATRELVSGRGELLPVQTFFREQRSNVNRALVDVAGAVDKLNMFYYNPDIGSGYAKKGYDFAQTLDWWCIAEQWTEVLLSVYESRRLDTPFFRDIMRPVRMEAI